MEMKGKIALVTGVANADSIAYGCARAFRRAGAQVVMTYLNEKTATYTRPLADELDVELFLPLDVESQDQMEAVFAAIRERYGKLHTVVHSMAFAPKDDLHGRVVDSSPAGFARAMDISVHSFCRMARLAEPLMTEGGALLTMSYYGAEKVVPNYNMMGACKAALEAVTRYIAFELGDKGIRAHAISPGPILTRAASGISHFDDLLQTAARKAPIHEPLTIDDVGNAAVFLASDATRHITATTLHVDSGYHVVG